MPLLLEHIDAIARQKKRGVLFVEFHPLALDPEAGEDLSEHDIMAWKTMPDSAWQSLPIRQQLIDWLDTNGIGWQRCGHYAQGGLMMGYRGQLFIDLPFDTTVPAFRALQAFLENSDGSMRHRGVFFVYCSFKKAMENAAHDEPGFLDRCAENF